MAIQVEFLSMFTLILSLIVNISFKFWLLEFYSLKSYFQILKIVYVPLGNCPENI